MIINKLLTKWQKRDADSKELLLHSVIAFFMRTLGAISVFLMSVVVARLLGAEESGYFFLGFAVITLLATLSRLGLEQTVLRYTGAAFPERDWSQIRSVLKKSLLLASTTGISVACLLWMLSDWLAVTVFEKPQMSQVLRYMSPGIIGLALFTLVAMSLQGIRRVGSSVFTLNIGANLGVILLLLLATKADSTQSALYFSAASVLTFIIGWLLWWQGQDRENQHNPIAWRALFSSCIPLWVVMLMHQMMQWSGQLLAGAWVDSSELAQLAVAHRTAMLTSFILVAVNLVVAPRFASMYRLGQMARMQSLSLASVRMMVLFALPIVAVMIFFPKFIMGLFGHDFRNGAHLLQILAIGQFINVATGSVGFLLSMSGHEKDLRDSTLIGGPVAVLAALMLIPVLGATGSAIATAFAVSIQNVLAVWYVKKRFGFNVLTAFVKS